MVVQDFGFAPRFPQLPDDLEGDEGLPGSGCHRQEDSPLCSDNPFKDPVDRRVLEIAWGLAAKGRSAEGVENRASLPFGGRRSEGFPGLCSQDEFAGWSGEVMITVPP